MSDDKKHAVYSPSGAHRWMTCPGSIQLSAGLPNEDSEYAKEGTAAHELAAMCLEGGVPTAGFIGRIIKKVEVTGEMAEEVQKYVDDIQGMASSNATLLVEQALPLEPITGEVDAEGTSDVVILFPDELVIVDLKYGKGYEVHAEGNPQLKTYALAALLEYDSITSYERVRTIIHQPRLNHVSEATYTRQELFDFGAAVVAAVEDSKLKPPSLIPGESQCRWCLAKATCPALQELVMDSVSFDDETRSCLASPDTEDMEVLSEMLSRVDLIKGWCEAVVARAERELRDGNTVPGYKLVQGRKGNKAWEDAEEAEAALKALRLKKEDMYDSKLISPTSAEKLAKAGTIKPKQWEKIKDHIVQPEGALKMVHESDKRPAVAVSNTDDMFEDLTQQ